MSTSTPPAWHWRDECAVPLATDPCPDCGGSHKPWVLCHEYAQMREEALSAGSCNPSDAATMGECNDSNQRPDCAGVQSVRETPTKLRVGARNEHPPETTSPADSCVVESCPECGAVTDILYEDGPHDIPFKTQEFMFEALIEFEIDRLHEIIDDHHEEIVEMARDRFRKGYAKFGSAMYSWSPERRLDETLQELADAAVYPTSGPIE